MRVSKEQAAESRERILDAASKLFREHGLDGIGVADLMKSAGLTHGGFYGHFSSKEDLMAQACTRAFARSVEKWEKLSEKDQPLSAIVKNYLSRRHRDDPGGGCALPSLGADVARQGAPVRRAFTDGVRSLTNVVARTVTGRTEAARRRKGLAICASLIGAIVLARAVDDQELSDEILDAVSASLGVE